MQTEYLIFSSKGNNIFRTDHLIDQLNDRFTGKLRNNNDFLDRVVASIVLLPTDYCAELPKDSIVRDKVVAKLSELPEHSQNGVCKYSVGDVFAAVRRRGDHLRHVRNSARAAAYLRRFPEKPAREGDSMNIICLLYTSPSPRDS